MTLTVGQDKAAAAVKLLVAGSVRCPTTGRFLVRVSDKELVLTGGSLVGNRKTGKIRIVCKRCKGNKDQRTHPISSDILRLE